MPLPPFRLTSHAAIQWLLLVLGLLFLGGVLGLNRYQDRRRIEIREQERLLSQAQIVQNILGKDLVSLYSVLGMQGQEWLLGGNNRQASRRLETLDKALTGVRTLVILDARGKARAASRRELIGRDLSGREYFQTARQSHSPDTLYVSTPFRSMLGVFIVTVSRMIKGPGGEFAGLVSAALDPEFFMPLLHSVLGTPDMRATIVHGDGALFLVAPDRPELLGLNMDQPGTIFRRHVESGGKTSLLQGQLVATGEEGYWAASTIQTPGVVKDKDLVVTIGRNPAAIFESWNKETRLQAILYGFSILISCVALFLYQRRKQAYERERAKAAREREDNARFLRSITNSIPGMVSYWSRDLRCGYANHAYQEWFGKSSDQMLGSSMLEVMGPELLAKNEPFIRAALQGEAQRFERTLTKSDGSVGHTLARFIPDMQEGQARGFFVLVADVTELKETQRELEARVKELNTLATTDALTGIDNRRRFLERAKAELERSYRYGQPLTFLLLDIDRFKDVNDTYGHDSGDAVLKHLTANFKETLRTTDSVGRLGGEEFGALLISTDLAAAKLVAERLRATVEAAVVLTSSGPVRYTISVGLAVTGGEEGAVDDFLKHADLALYNAKERGRNRVSSYGEF